MPDRSAWRKSLAGIFLYLTLAFVYSYGQNMAGKPLPADPASRAGALTIILGLPIACFSLAIIFYVLERDRRRREDYLKRPVRGVSDADRNAHQPGMQGIGDGVASDNREH